MTDVDDAVNAIEQVLSRHQNLMYEISHVVSSVFEALCMTHFAECYDRKLGYQVSVIRSHNGYFRFKYSTKGDPRNYSAFKITKNKKSFEIIHNLFVEGKNDPDVKYVLDIAVVNENRFKESKTIRKNRTYSIAYYENKDLITFAECKHILAYNMLIAQFLGIVFEIKPHHLDPTNFNRLSRLKHILPSLLISGKSHIGAETLIASLKTRKYAVIVATNLFSSPDEFFNSVKGR